MESIIFISRRVKQAVFNPIVVLTGVALCFLLLTPAFPQDCPEFQGRWPYGPSRMVDMEGNYAYFGSGAALIIADIIDPSTPVKVGEIILDSSRFDVSNSYLYLVDENGFRIVDANDPSLPEEVGICDSPGNYIAVSGNYAYVLDRYAGLRVIDISDPFSPTQVGFYEKSYLSVRDFSVSGNYAFLSRNYSGFTILDISDPFSPVEVGSYDTSGNANHVVASGNFAYVAYGYDGLLVLDISDPSAPVEVGSHDTPGYALRVMISGNVAYIADEYKGLRIFDISLPSAPEEVGYYDTPGTARGVAVSGNYACIADLDSGLRIIDILSPSSPVEVGYYDTPGRNGKVIISGDYVYVAEYGRGLRIFDISTLSAPVEVGFIGGLAYDVVVSGNYAYAAANIYGLWIIDVSVPSVPVSLGYFDTPGYAEDIGLSGNYAYVADYWAFRIIDVSDPSTPTEVGFLDYYDGIRADKVAVSGSYAYVADQIDGIIHIIDISDPTTPVVVGSFDSFDHYSISDIAVSGNYAYVTDVDQGLMIIDISTPSAPLEVGSYSTPGFTHGVAVSGSYAFIADDTNGLLIIDIYDPSEPVEVGFYDGVVLVRDVTVSGNIASIATEYYGFTFVSISDCCTEAPGDFNLNSPFDGAVFQICSLFLDWEESSEALNYDLYLDTVNPPVTLTGEALRVSEFPATLDSETTYYWKVVAQNGCGSMESQVYSFTTGKPATFDLRIPPSGAENQPVSLTLDWEYSEGFEYFSLFLGTSIDPPLYQDQLLESQFDIEGLELNTTYYWYVEAVNNCGMTKSRKGTFTTGMPVLRISSVDLLDSCLAGGLGDGNGQVDSHETVEMILILENDGVVDATGIHANLITSTPGIWLMRDGSYFPDIPMGSTGAPYISFTFKLQSEITCLDTIGFELQMTGNEGSWLDSFQVPVGQGSGQILSESFETWPPAGWQIIDNGGDCTWDSTTATGIPNYAGGDGPAAAADSDGCGAGKFVTMDTELWTPVLHLPAGSTSTLTFTAAYQDSQPGGDLLEVDISTDGGYNWEKLLSWDESHDPYGPGEEVQIDLTSFTGSTNTIIRFHYLSTGWDWWAIVDSIQVELSPYCFCCSPNPVNLLYPENNASVHSGYQTLDWETSVDADHYDLYLGTENPPPLYRSGLMHSQFDMTSEPNRVYYWRVESVNSCNVISSDTFSFDTNCLVKSAHWPGGLSRGVTVKDNFAFFLNGFSLVVLDISDPNNPIKIKEIDMPSNYYGNDKIAVYENLLISTTDMDFRVLDISDPGNPVVIDILDRMGQGLGVQGNYAYYMGHHDNLLVVDISNPRQINIVEEYYPGDVWITAVDVEGSFAYLADDWSGFKIVDISDPTNLHEIGYWEPSPYAYGITDIAVKNEFAYVKGYSQVKFSVVDISDPSNPTEIGSCDADGYSIFLKGDYAYTASSHFTIVDISAPSNPFIVSSVELPSSSASIHVDGDYAYVTTEHDGLRILDISDPTVPFEVGAYSGPEATKKMAISDNRLACLTDERLYLADITSPSDPHYLTALPNNSMKSIEITMTHTFSTEYFTLRIVDITDPLNPTEAGTFDLGGYGYDLELSLPYIFAAAGQEGLHIIDVSDPSSPSGISNFTGAGYDLRSVKVKGHYAFLLDPGFGIRIADISNLSTPTEIGQYEFGAAAVQYIAISSDYLFAYSDDDWIHIIDIIDPTNPSLVNSVPFSVNSEMSVMGSILIAPDINEVTLIEFSNPYSLEIQSVWYPTGSIPVIYASITSGHYLYVSSLNYGVEVVDLFSCCQNAPGLFGELNPMDGSDNLACNFTLDWEDSSEAIYYDLYLDTVNPPVTLAGEALRFSEFQVSLDPGTTYYWKVVAQNGCGTTETPVFSFSTAPVPGAFAMLDPLNNAMDVHTVDLLLDWEESPGALTYNLYFGTAPSPPLFQEGLTDHQFIHTGLEGGVTYTWTVEAISPCGQVMASTGVYSFTTANPREVPADGLWVVKNDSFLTLSWEATCGDAATYTVYEGDLQSLYTTGIYNHVSIDCFDEGADRTENIISAPGETYYLVVPRTSGGVEGSYGHDRPLGTDFAFCGIIAFQPEGCS